MKPLDPVHLSQLAEQKYRTWYVEIDPTRTPIEDVFRPQFWVNCGKMMKPDLVRVRAIDGSYDMMLSITGKTVAGKTAIKVEIWPNVPDYVLLAAQSATEMLPTTIGGKPVPRVDYAQADGFRVIGFNGDIASRGHESEAAANVAMAEYIHVFGIKSVADRPAVDARTGAAEAVKPAPVTEDDKAPVDLNLSFARRKEIEDKAKKDARRKADIEAMEKRKAASEGATS